MACNPIGFLAYNERDLVPDGFIFPTIVTQYPVGTSPPQQRIDHPEPGVTYTQVPLPTSSSSSSSSSSSPTLVWLETRRQLPARRLMVEFLFRKTTKSGQTSLAGVNSDNGQGALGFGLLGGGAGSLATIIANTILLGGLSSGNTEFSFHICESQTLYNVPIRIPFGINPTATSIDIELSQFPLSVFSVTTAPVVFTDEQKRHLGKNSHRIVRGGIQGTNTPEGQFFGDVADELLFPPAITPGSITINIFEKIIYDDRRLPYRADNKDSPVYNYAFKTDGENHNDITSRKIRIKNLGFTLGATVYITGCFATKRVTRHLIKHKGTLFEGASPVPIPSEVLNIGFSVNAWNFSLAKWRVPSDGGSTSPPVTIGLLNSGDTIEGWRISENQSTEFTKFFAADHRGILLISRTAPVQILYPASALVGQAWWTNFLTDTGYDVREVTPSIEDRENFGLLFDISEHVNTVLVDQDKVPYHRPFALALSKRSSTLPPIGVPNLDLFTATPPISGTGTFDLSSAVFNPSNMTSVVPSAYSGAACSSVRNSSIYYDPTESVNGRNIYNLSYLFPTPPSNIQSDWLLETPFFTGTFNSSTRVFMERFGMDSLDGRTKGYSIIYVRTLAATESSLSLDTSPYYDQSYLAFSAATGGALSYLYLTDGTLMRQPPLLTQDNSLNHTVPAFTHEPFRVIGYGKVLGQAPNYSSGRPVSRELFEVCNGHVTWASLFQEVTIPIPAIASGPSYVLVTPNDPMRFLTITYTINPTAVTPTTDDSISVKFNEADIVSCVKVPVGDGPQTLIVDTRFYSASSVTLAGQILSLMTITSIKASMSQNNAVGQYIEHGSQTACAFDAGGSYYIFFVEGDNLSVAITVNLGTTWAVHRGIVRTVSGERVTLPYIANDKKSNLFHLFYRLNDQFLMYKKIDPRWFECADAFLTYAPLSSFVAATADDEGLTNYTSGGKSLLKEPSFFVCGDASTPFFVTETTTSAARQAARLSYRYAFSGNTSHLDSSFAAATFAVFRDARGVVRVFFTADDGAMRIKYSANLTSWQYLAQVTTFHKNFFSDDPQTHDLKVSNPQIVYRPGDEEFYVFYFNQGMLFFRVFQINLLLPESSSSSSSSSSLSPLMAHLSVTSGSQNRPHFLVGTLASNIVTDLAAPSANLAVVFPYPLPLRTQFSSGFEVEAQSKPVGYKQKNGTIRLIYKASNGLLFGSSIKGLKTTLDAQLRFP